MVKIGDSIVGDVDFTLIITRDTYWEAYTAPGDCTFIDFDSGEIPIVTQQNKMCFDLEIMYYRFQENYPILD